MALIRQFHSQQTAEDESETYALARDVLSDRVFVLHCRTHRIGAIIHDSETKIPLGDFLNLAGPAQTQLLELIGSLVVEE